MADIHDIVLSIVLTLVVQSRVTFCLCWCNWWITVFLAIAVDAECCSNWKITVGDFQVSFGFCFQTTTVWL